LAENRLKNGFWKDFHQQDSRITEGDCPRKTRVFALHFIVVAIYLFYLCSLLLNDIVIFTNTSLIKQLILWQI
jgi:hypothetical protein